MEVLSETEVIKILNEVINKEEIVKINIEPGIKKGEGFLSVITKVDITDKAKSYNLIIKSVPKAEQLGKHTPVKLCFQQEIHFYKVIMPTLLNFQHERKITQIFCSIPKCLQTSTEYLVFENIKENGYVLPDRRLEMDAEHTSLVLTECARFHATSFAFKDQYPKKFRELESGVVKLFVPKYFPGCFEAFTICSEKLPDLFDPILEKELYESVKNFANSVPEFFQWFENDINERRIFVHGDCWPNNILFKYTNPNKPTTPTNICFLDFQLLRVSSPIIDISYFLSLSASKCILDHLDDYLKLYYNSFCEHVQKLGSDPEKLYPYSVLKEEWKVYSKYGFIIGLTFLRSTVRTDDEILDYTDLNENFSIVELFLRESKSDDAINSRLKNLITHMYETGLL